MNKLTHFDSSGQAHMVDVGSKPHTHRIAMAKGRIEMRPETLAAVQAGTSKKGDVLGIARIAGIQGAKRTSELIPLCHPVALTRMAIDFEVVEQSESAPAHITCIGTAETVGQTGVEMEALTAVQVALLTVYDMCKAADRSMAITQVILLEKHGGMSGSYTKPA